MQVRARWRLLAKLMGADSTEEDLGDAAPHTPPLPEEEATADGAGSEGKTELEEGNAKKDDEDSDDAWGDWTKKGKEEEQEEDEDEEWGDWTKSGSSSKKKKKEKTVNPFTLLLQKGKGKGGDNGNRHHMRRDRGGRRDGKGHGRNLAAQARAEALARERMAMQRVAALGRAMLNRHVVPPKLGMPPRPPLPLNLGPRLLAPPAAFAMRPPGMTVPSRPLYPPAQAPGASGVPPGHWMPQVPPPAVPARPGAIPPRPVSGPTARATPSSSAPTPSPMPVTPPLRPKQKARPTPRAALARSSVPKPTKRPQPSQKPAEPTKPPDASKLKPAEPSKPPTARVPTPVGKPATNGVKRPREEGFADELAEWLLNLDRGKGVMLEYHEGMAQNCSSWKELVDWAVQDLDTKKMVFSKPFLKSTALSKTGHKIMFACGFRKLINERLKEQEQEEQQPTAPSPSQGRRHSVPQPSQRSAARNGQSAPQTPPKPQPKRMPLQRQLADEHMPEETAELEPSMAEPEEEFQEVACDPPADSAEQATLDKLWQDLVQGQEADEEEGSLLDQLATKDDAWAETGGEEQEAPAGWSEEMAEEPPAQEASTDAWVAELEEEVEKDPELGARFAAAMHEVYKDGADEDEEVELEIPDKVPVPLPAARSRPFSAFSNKAPQTVPPRHGQPRSSPGVRTARPPSAPPPARLLQGRQPPPEPTSQPQVKVRRRS